MKATHTEIEDEEKSKIIRIKFCVLGFFFVCCFVSLFYVFFFTLVFSSLSMLLLHDDNMYVLFLPHCFGCTQWLDYPYVVAKFIHILNKCTLSPLCCSIFTFIRSNTHNLVFFHSYSITRNDRSSSMNMNSNLATRKMYWTTILHYQHMSEIIWADFFSIYLYVVFLKVFSNVKIHL